MAGEIIEAAGVAGGLVAHVGCGDGRLTAALRLNEGYLVHGLASKADHVESAREHVDALGLSGEVAIDRLPDNHLPYIDNSVNLLVAEDEALGDIPESEVMRVLAPGGVAYRKSGVAGGKTVKPWPDEIDGEWSHYLRGMDNNAVAQDTVAGPPRHVQWLAEPRWTRNHHTLNSVSSSVTADGRLFYINDEASPANINLPPKWTIVARDAFSGVTLWKKPMESWLDHTHGFRSGPPQAPRLLVASADRLYTPLTVNGPISALDATTGERLDTYPETKGAEEIILSSGTLLALVGEPEPEHAFTHASIQERYGLPNEKALVAIDAATGEKLWRRTPEGHPRPKTLASDGANVYLRVGDDGVVCLDLDTGENQWRYGGLDREASRGGNISYGRHTLVVQKGVVACTVGNELVALCVEDGSVLWRTETMPGFHAPPDVFVIGQLVWHRLDHRSDSVAPISEIEGLDLQTGEVRERNSLSGQVKTAGHHYRCYRAKATARFLITARRGVELFDLDGEEHSRNNWVRGACQYGVLPANGLIYAPPHSCGCYMETMMHGYGAYAAKQAAVTDPEYQLDHDARLETGPAYENIGERTAEEGEPWPTYRGDALRRSVSATEVPAKLEQAWSAELGGGQLTQPVVAEGYVLVADRDAGIVYALDKDSGAVQWKHHAGGRIDSSPTIHEGLALFGSADGRVTCLRLADGERVWRFLAAPTDLRIVAFDRLESPWPVHGSVLVLNGVAYFSAGRSSWLDGGIYLYGVEPATGEVVYETHYESEHPEFRREEAPEEAPPEEQIAQNVLDYKTFEHSDRSDAFSMGAGSISDVLVSDGESVFLHHRKFSSALEKQDELSPHLFSTSSLLDDAENHRSHWLVGTGDFSRLPVAYSWIVNTGGYGEVVVPYGTILAYDESHVWGVQRRRQHQVASGEYQLFRQQNAPFLADEWESKPDIRQDAPGREYVWREELPARPRAIVKAGERLYLGVMPVEIPEDDPHASYEGRKGGSILVYHKDDGSEPIAEYALEAPVAWDGMAAANGRLYAATKDGNLLCLEKAQTP